MKILKAISLAACILIVLGLGYLILINYQCKEYLQGVSNSSLEIDGGVAFLVGSDIPYTGHVYSTVCGGECGFMSCALIHWRGEYKEGKLHGKFDAPMSGVGDKHWFNPGDETETYFYENGTRIR